MRRLHVAGGLFLLAAGCAHADAAADRHITDLRNSIGKLEAEQDQRVARVDDPSPPKPAAPKTSPSAGRSVQIGDDEGGESDDPNDPTARPEIRVQGTAMPRAAR